MLDGKQQEIYSFETSTSKTQKNLVNNRKQSDSKALMMKEQTLIDFFQSTGDGKTLCIRHEMKNGSYVQRSFNMKLELPVRTSLNFFLFLCITNTFYKFLVPRFCKTLRVFPINLFQTLHILQRNIKFILYCHLDQQYTQ